MGGKKERKKQNSKFVLLGPGTTAAAAAAKEMGASKKKRDLFSTSFDRYNNPQLDCQMQKEKKKKKKNQGMKRKRGIEFTTPFSIVWEGKKATGPFDCSISHFLESFDFHTLHLFE